MSPLPDVILNDKTRMPIRGFGTWQLSGESAYDSVRAALEVGYRHLDTATLYQNEAEVGRAVRDSGVDRNDIYITTKLRPGDAGRELQMIDKSVRALGVDQIDLWLIHWPPGDPVATWEALLKIRDQGLTRSVGVSNFSLAQIDELTRVTGVTPSVNQIPWSPDQHDPGLLAGHADRGVVLEGYSPLKRTDLSDPVLVEIASRHGVTPAQVVLRWHLEHAIVVLPRSHRRERIAANFDLTGFSLSPEEIGRIDRL